MVSSVIKKQYVIVETETSTRCAQHQKHLRVSVLQFSTKTMYFEQFYSKNFFFSLNTRMFIFSVNLAGLGVRLITSFKYDRGHRVNSKRPSLCILQEDSTLASKTNRLIIHKYVRKTLSSFSWKWTVS